MTGGGNEKTSSERSSFLGSPCNGKEVKRLVTLTLEGLVAAEWAE